jgi:alpha-tubulin suppressor-like RCC1 family protein
MPSCSPYKTWPFPRLARFLFAALLTTCACRDDEPPCLGAKVVAAIDHSCILKQDGSLRCWGTLGAQLARTPVARPEWGTGVTELVSRGVVDCARRNAAGVSCGVDAPREVPALDGANVLAMGVSLSRQERLIVCASGIQGTVLCGRLGAPEAFAPEPVDGVGNVNALAVGETLACGRAVDGSLWCWGHGYMGDGMAARTASTAVRVTALGQDMAGVSVGLRTACAVTNDGGVLCWGANDSGEAGREERPLLVPTRVEGLPPVQTINMGAEHACAVSRTAELWCWGRNRERQLGAAIGGVLSIARPVLVPLAGKVAEISAGVGHTCARDVEGIVRCWGSNELGQVGMGSDLIVRAPTPVAPCP